MFLSSLLIISSLLFGSVLSNIFSTKLVYNYGLNLYPSGGVDGIPLFSEDFALSKTFDLVEFILFIASSIGIFTVLYFIHRFKKRTNIWTGIVLFVASFILYLTSMFAVYAELQTAGIILLLIILIPLINLPNKFPKWDEGKYALLNGIITGFFLSIFIHKLTPSLSIPLMLLVITPVFFYLYSDKFKQLNKPSFLLLLFGTLVPYNMALLSSLGIITLISVIVTFPSKYKLSAKARDNIYVIALIFLFLFNPLFYFGSFDSVEEGFWAGWLQRMLEGQNMYGDFAIYHPPALTAGLYVFTKLLGESLYNMRLYFHLLQILGSVIIFYILKELVKTNWVRIIIFILILAYGSSQVRNNAEIRLATGMLPLLFIYYYNQTKKSKNIIFAGISSIVALMVSIETGIASVLAASSMLLLSSNRYEIIKNGLNYLKGLLIISVPVVLYLQFTNSLSKFIEYLYFYPRSFSLGYQNIVMERPGRSNLIIWFDVNRYLNFTGFMWELARATLVGSLLFAAVNRLKNKLNAKEYLFLGLSLFGLILSRSAVSRSDHYHINFIWIVSLLLIGYLVQLLSVRYKTLAIVTVSFLVFVVARNNINNSLIQPHLTKIQAYANLAGDYPSYNTERSLLSANIDINTTETDNLVEFVQNQVKEDETLFVFPHGPELYFLTDRNNATTYDSPTIFFTDKYQDNMIAEMETNKPKLILYDPTFSIAGIGTGTLSKVDEYILNNFEETHAFGKIKVMKPIN